MRGINKVILVGSLGANPIAKHFPNGSGYARNFQLQQVNVGKINKRVNIVKIPNGIAS